MTNCAVLLIILFFSLRVLCETHALFVSGIGVWDRFSLSSDASVYHSYWDLLQGGVKPENMIIMSINNAATSPKNPNPGNVGYYGGFNLYPFVEDRIDYQGHDVNPENLYKVLLGEDMGNIGSGRSLQTSEEDDLFVISMNHGMLGQAAFMYEDDSFKDEEPMPEIMWGYDLVATIKQMQSEKKFRNLVWIMCSCYSGSMFSRQFGENENVYFMTAASVDREAMACDYDPSLNLPTSGCLHQTWQKFLKINEGQLDKKSLMDQYRYAYSQKVNVGAFLIEEYCDYGNTKFAETTSVTMFEGNFRNKTGRLRPPDRKTSPIRPISMSDASPFKHRNMHSMKKVVLKNDPPMKGMIQLNITGFDGGYAMCNPPGKMDLGCVKNFYSQCFKYYHSNPKFWTCCYSDPVADLVRLGCSEGAKTDPPTLFKIMLQAPCQDLNVTTINF